MINGLEDKKIGVIAGGVSAEREVSLKSGEAVYRALKARGYNALFIDAGHKVYEQIKDHDIDIAFLVLHGGWGENGAIQGMLEIMGIPYTGSGVLASALSMDKVASKMMFSQSGLRVPGYRVIYDEGGLDNLNFDLPVVVKPSREGSSVGVSIVDSKEQLHEAIKEASRYGWPVIVEEYIKAREIQVGILDDEVLGAVEVRPKRRFYDYIAKYTPGSTEYILPPELPEELYERCKFAGLTAHRALGCRGATRVDLLVTDEGQIYVLEVNTIPGMTETSLLPKIATLAGYSFEDLIERILELSIKEQSRNEK